MMIVILESITKIIDFYLTHIVTLREKVTQVK